MLKAANFYKRVAAQKGDNPKVYFDVAVAHRRCGEVHHKLGEIERSKLAFAEAIERFQALLAQSPDDVNFRRELAKCFDGLGVMLAESDIANDDELGATAMLLKAVALWRGLHRQLPGETEYIRKLVRADLQAAHVLSFRSDEQRRQGKQLYDEAEQLARALVKNDPTAQHHCLLGFTLSRRGFAALLFNLAPQHAAPYYQAAIEELETSLRLNSRNPHAREYLGESYCYLGASLKSLGRKDEGRKAVEHAVEIHEQLVNDFPKTTKFRAALGTTYSVLAGDFLDENDLDAARKYYQLAIDSGSAEWKADGKSLWPLVAPVIFSGIAGSSSSSLFVNRTPKNLSVRSPNIGKNSLSSFGDPASCRAWAEVNLSQPATLRQLQTSQPWKQCMFLRSRGIYYGSQFFPALDLPEHSKLEDWESDPVLAAVRRLLRLSTSESPLVLPEFDSLDHAQRRQVVASAALLGSIFEQSDHNSEAARFFEFAHDRSDTLTASSEDTGDDPAERKRTALLLALIGEGLATVGEHGHAVRAYESSRSIAPSDFVGWARVGIELIFYPHEPFHDRRKGAELLNHALTVEPENVEWRYPLALAQYRDGDYSASLANFETIMNSHAKFYQPGGINDKEGSAWDFFYVAMNHAQLAHPNEARSWFARGVAWMEKHDPSQDSSNPDAAFPSQDWMERNVPGYTDLRALHREAAALIDPAERRTPRE